MPFIPAYIAGVSAVVGLAALYMSYRTVRRVGLANAREQIIITAVSLGSAVALLLPEY